MTPEQKKNNARLAWILAWGTVLLGRAVGFV